MSVRRIKALAKKEFIQMIRDPISLIAALFIPVLMIFLFGYALNLDVDRIPTVILDLDKTPASRNLVNRLDDSKYFSLQGFLERESEIDEALSSGEALLAVVVPAGFGSRVKQGLEVDIQAVLDGMDSNTGAIAKGYVTALVAGFDMELQKQRLKKAGLRVTDMPLEARIRVWFNPELKSRNFIVPGLSAVIMMAICSILTSMTVSRERETGTLEQLVSTPVTEGELMIGKLLPYICVGLVDMVMVVGAAVLIFKVPFRGSYIFMFSTALIFLVGTLSWGLFISVTAKSQLQASQITMVTVFLPSFLLSGLVYPIANMPAPLQAITYAVPAKYFVEILRGVFLQGIGLEYLWPQVLAMCIYAFIVLNLARKKFSKRLM